MKRYKFSLVTISREEYDDYIKARFLVQHVLQSIKFNGAKELYYTMIKTEVIESYYPEEVEKIRRMKNEHYSNITGTVGQDTVEHVRANYY